MDGWINAMLHVREKIRVDQSGIRSEHTIISKIKIIPD